MNESKDLSSLIDLSGLNDLKTLLFYRLMAVGYKVYTFKVRFAILWKCSGSFTTYVISNSRKNTFMLIRPFFACIIQGQNLLAIVQPLSFALSFFSCKRKHVKSLTLSKKIVKSLRSLDIKGQKVYIFLAR